MSSRLLRTTLVAALLTGATALGAPAAMAARADCAEGSACAWKDDFFQGKKISVKCPTAPRDQAQVDAFIHRQSVQARQFGIYGKLSSVRNRCPYPLTVFLIPQAQRTIPSGGELGRLSYTRFNGVSLNNKPFLLFPAP